MTSPSSPAQDSELGTATIACPACRHVSEAAMPADACVFFYECPGCGTVLRPKPGDCCVFCSYGSTPCPPVRTGCC
jgi:hypothetical protein